MESVIGGLVQFRAIKVDEPSLIPAFESVFLTSVRGHVQWSDATARSHGAGVLRSAAQLAEFSDEDFRQTPALTDKSSLIFQLLTASGLHLMELAIPSQEASAWQTLISGQFDDCTLQDGAFDAEDPSVQDFPALFTALVSPTAVDISVDGRVLTVYVAAEGDADAVVQQLLAQVPPEAVEELEAMVAVQKAQIALLQRMLPSARRCLNRSFQQFHQVLELAEHYLLAEQHIETLTQSMDAMEGILLDWQEKREQQQVYGKNWKQKLDFVQKENEALVQELQETKAELRRQRMFIETNEQTAAVLTLREENKRLKELNMEMQQMLQQREQLTSDWRLQQEEEALIRQDEANDAVILSLDLPKLIRQQQRRQSQHAKGANEEEALAAGAVALSPLSSPHSPGVYDSILRELTTTQSSSPDWTLAFAELFPAPVAEDQHMLCILALRALRYGYIEQRLYRSCYDHYSRGGGGMSFSRFLRFVKDFHFLMTQTAAALPTGAPPAEELLSYGEVTMIFYAAARAEVPDYQRKPDVFKVRPMQSPYASAAPPPSKASGVTSPAPTPASNAGPFATELLQNSSLTRLQFKLAVEQIAERMYSSLILLATGKHTQYLLPHERDKVLQACVQLLLVKVVVPTALSLDLLPWPLLQVQQVLDSVQRDAAMIHLLVDQAHVVARLFFFYCLRPHQTQLGANQIAFDDCLQLLKDFELLPALIGEHQVYNIFQELHHVQHALLRAPRADIDSFFPPLQLPPALRQRLEFLFQRDLSQLLTWPRELRGQAKGQEQEPSPLDIEQFVVFLGVVAKQALGLAPTLSQMQKLLRIIEANAKQPTHAP